MYIYKDTHTSIYIYIYIYTCIIYYIYYKEGVSQKFWEDDVLKNLGKIMQAGHCLANTQWVFPMQLGSMVHCMGLGGVIPLVGPRVKVSKGPTILRYFKPENS